MRVLSMFASLLMLCAAVPRAVLSAGTASVTLYTDAACTTVSVIDGHSQIWSSPANDCGPDANGNTAMTIRTRCTLGDDNAQQVLWNYAADDPTCAGSAGTWEPKAAGANLCFLWDDPINPGYARMSCTAEPESSSSASDGPASASSSTAAAATGNGLGASSSTGVHLHCIPGLTCGASALGLSSAMLAALAAVVIAAAQRL